ncbi:MAG: Phosphonate transporter phosphate-binding periplasmic component [Labilithrix sp.]|nr:Phosphonate transporter phosphate-binding periplasmic component [Labilithrix sp.]
MPGVRQRLTFGLVPPASFLNVEPRVNAFLRWVSERAGIELVRRHARSYDELVKLVRAGDLDVAWLPPIPFATLRGEALVRALVCADRGDDAYVSVLVARPDGPVHTADDARGRRIGWVDPLSAAGYVVPRMRLAARFGASGSPFASESFFGSHAAVARAVVDGTVDVGATYGRRADGQLVCGPLPEDSAGQLRVVEVLGSIPPDVIAVHASVVDTEIVAALVRAFEGASRDPVVRGYVLELFGATSFVEKPMNGHDLLGAELERGVDSGVIPAAAVFLSTRPPPSNFR